MTNSSMEPITAAAVVENYRLLSIDPTASPSGDAEGDWLVYRIAQGTNVVTGYRRGSRPSVTAEAERIVEALNERLLVKGKPHRSAGRVAKAQAT